MAQGSNTNGQSQPIYLTDDAGASAGTAGNPIRVSSVSGGGSQQVEGTVANGATDTGNPVKIGGRVDTTATATTASGNRIDSIFDSVGSQRVVVTRNVTFSAAMDGAYTSASYLQLPNSPGTIAPLMVLPGLSMGGNWVRQPGDATGTYVVPGFNPAGTDRSGTAATTSGTLAAANTARRGLNIQNIGGNNLGVNEFGGTAAIGTAGTYLLTPGSTMTIRTNRLVTVIAATGATAYTATEF